MPIERYKLEQRIFGLAKLVQDPDVHRSFKPGTKWWIPYKTKRSEKMYPNALTILDQLQVSIEDFQRCFSPPWNSNFSAVLPDFRFNKFSDVFFMTVDVALKDDGYSIAVSHPTNDTIVDQ